MHTLFTVFAKVTPGQANPMFAEAMGDLIGWVYSLILPILASAAVLTIIIAGFQMMLSQGNSESAGAAGERLKGAIFGLALVILLSIILHEINPAVFNL